MERGRLYGLDALRGIAAMLVFWHHLQAVYGFDLLPVAGVSAVDLFLVLSGFVMARTYEGRMPSPIRFLAIRYKRLWPVMAIGTTAGMAFYLIAEGPTLDRFLVFAATLAFMPWPPIFSVNYPAWSIFCEVVANALHSAVFARVSSKTLFMFFVWLAIAFGTVTLTIDQIAWGSSPVGLAVATLRCLCCYLAGILIWRTYGDRPIASVAVGRIGVITSLILGAYAPALFSVAFALIGAPLLVRCFMGMEKSRFAAFAGAASFPLYAVHWPVLKLCLTAGVGPFLAAFVTLAATIAVTLLVGKRAVQPILSPCGTTEPPVDVAA